MSLFTKKDMYNEDAIFTSDSFFQEQYVQGAVVEEKDLRVGQRVRIVKAKPDCMESDIPTFLGKEGFLDSSDTPRNYDHPDLIVISDNDTLLLSDFEVEPY